MIIKLHLLTDFSVNEYDKMHADIVLRMVALGAKKGSRRDSKQPPLHFFS
jgi:hypothetical protein